MQEARAQSWLIPRSGKGLLKCTRAQPPSRSAHLARHLISRPGHPGVSPMDAAQPRWQSPLPPSPPPPPPPWRLSILGLRPRPTAQLGMSSMRTASSSRAPNSRLNARSPAPLTVRRPPAAEAALHATSGHTGARAPGHRRSPRFSQQPSSLLTPAARTGGELWQDFSDVVKGKNPCGALANRASCTARMPHPPPSKAPLAPLPLQLRLPLVHLLQTWISRTGSSSSTSGTGPLRCPRTRACSGTRSACAPRGAGVWQACSRRSTLAWLARLLTVTPSLLPTPLQDLHGQQVGRGEGPAQHGVHPAGIRSRSLLLRVGDLAHRLGQRRGVLRPVVLQQGQRLVEPVDGHLAGLRPADAGHHVRARVGGH